MKKIIMLIVGVALAVSARAASTDWQLTCGNLKDHSGAAFAGLFEIYASGGDLTTETLILSVNPSNATYNKYAFSVTDILTADTTYNLYYKITDGAYTLTSETKQVKALGTGAANLSWGNQATYTGNSGNWAAAPEPTSGLLLLLGVAGLALKRKRA